MSYQLNIDTNASSGASGSNTFGAKTYGGTHQAGVPTWALVAIAALAALVLLRKGKG